MLYAVDMYLTASAWLAVGRMALMRFIAKHCRTVNPARRRASGRPTSKCWCKAQGTVSDTRGKPCCADHCKMDSRFEL
eukprot:3825584-Amphidinium_carterae.1